MDFWTYNKHGSSWERFFDSAHLCIKKITGPSSSCGCTSSKTIRRNDQLDSLSVLWQVWSFWEFVGLLILLT